MIIPCTPHMKVSPESRKLSLPNKFSLSLLHTFSYSGQSSCNHFCLPFCSFFSPPNLSATHTGSTFKINPHQASSPPLPPLSPWINAIASLLTSLFNLLLLLLPIINRIAIMILVRHIRICHSFAKIPSMALSCLTDHHDPTLSGSWKTFWPHLLVLFRWSIWFSHTSLLASPQTIKHFPIIDISSVDPIGWKNFPRYPHDLLPPFLQASAQLPPSYWHLYSSPHLELTSCPNCFIFFLVFFFFKDLLLSKIFHLLIYYVWCLTFLTRIWVLWSQEFLPVLLTAIVSASKIIPDTKLLKKCLLNEGIRNLFQILILYHVSWVGIYKYVQVSWKKLYVILIPLCEFVLNSVSVFVKI